MDEVALQRKVAEGLGVHIESEAEQTINNLDWLTVATTTTTALPFVLLPHHCLWTSPLITATLLLILNSRNTTLVSKISSYSLGPTKYFQTQSHQEIAKAPLHSRHLHTKNQRSRLQSLDQTPTATPSPFSTLSSTSSRPNTSVICRFSTLIRRCSRGSLNSNFIPPKH